MSGMIKSLRSGADRAAFEAGKLMRLQRVQTEQKVQEQQRRTHLEQLGEAVWRLYAQGRISEPELVSICHQIQTTTHQIVELQKTAARLRRAQAAGASKCLDCGHDLNAGESVCPFCGAKAPLEDPPATELPSATELPPASQLAAANACPGCGHTARPGAAYCGHCGGRLTGQ